jgi:hypothetical protein
MELGKNGITLNIARQDWAASSIRLLWLSTSSSI